MSLARDLFPFSSLHKIKRDINSSYLSFADRHAGGDSRLCTEQAHLSPFGFIITSAREVYRIILSQLVNKGSTDRVLNNLTLYLHFQVHSTTRMQTSSPGLELWTVWPTLSLLKASDIPKLGRIFPVSQIQTKIVEIYTSLVKRSARLNTNLVVRFSFTVCTLRDYIHLFIYRLIYSSTFQVEINGSRVLIYLTKSDKIQNQLG